MDILARRLDVELSEDELTRRGRPGVVRSVLTGVLGRYVAQVLGAETGAVLGSPRAVRPRRVPEGR